MTYEKAHELTGNTQMAYYVLAAEKLGIEYEVIIPALFTQFSKNGKTWRIHKSLVPINDSVAMSLSSYKNTCITFLDKEGFSVPKQRKVFKAEDIKDFIEEKKLEHIVVKPSKGFGGGGVTILPHPDSIEESYTYARDKNLGLTEPRVLVEEFVHGRHYRLVVLGDEVIAAAERIQPFVVGDGQSDVMALIEAKNLELEKMPRPTIKVDEETDKALQMQSKEQNSVPEKDERVIVRLNANMTTGGSTRECLAEIDETYRQMAVKVIKAVGLEFGGLDVIAPDLTDPDGGYTINEVNHNPGLRIHYMPDEGEPFDLALKVQEYIMESNS